MATADEPGGRSGFLRRLFRLPAPTRHREPAEVAGYASSRIDAELMASYLRSQGVKAFVSADDEGGLNPALQTGDRVRVLGPPHQHGTARDLIDKRR